MRVYIDHGNRSGRNGLASRARRAIRHRAAFAVLVAALALPADASAAAEQPAPEQLQLVVHRIDIRGPQRQAATTEFSFQFRILRRSASCDGPGRLCPDGGHLEQTFATRPGDAVSLPDAVPLNRGVKPGSDDTVIVDVSAEVQASREDVLGWVSAEFTRRDAWGLGRHRATSRDGAPDGGRFDVEYEIRPMPGAVRGAGSRSDADRAVSAPAPTLFDVGFRP